MSLVTALLVLLLTGCGGDEADRGTSQKINDPGPVHVHGLGVNPRDGALFIATHTGLFRAPEGERRSERVADRYQDTMGFTVIGPDRFLGSGHPDFQADPDLPPLLGLIESDDAGKTWDRVSLLGDADFHVLEASGRRVYGFDSSGSRLMVSKDGGARWSELHTPEPLFSLAIDPGDPAHVIASGESGLYESRKGARGWRRVTGDPGLLGWASPGRLYMVTAEGLVQTSRAPGGRWREVDQLGGQPAAFEADRDRALYAALHDGTVKRSIDGGKSWTVRSQP